MNLEKRFATLAGLLVLLGPMTPGASAVPSPGTYTGTTQQGRSFSLVVDASGHVRSWSVGFTCGATNGTTSVSTDCTPIGNSFSCGTASCIPYQAMSHITGTFGGSSVTGTFDLSQMPDAISSCCSLAGQTFSASLPGPPACAADADTMCLDDTSGDRRFRIEVAYQTAQAGGRSGNGQAVSLAAEGVTRGGLFWFFAADNPELLIKVLNGCALNQKYWVFFSAGTNVGVTIRVDDTTTGEYKVYTYSDGHPVPTVQDTTALPCS